MIETSNEGCVCRARADRLVTRVVFAGQGLIETSNEGGVCRARVTRLT